MRRILSICGCVTSIVLAPLYGQGPALAGAGYTNPTAIRVSPGQITTVFVSGLKLDPTKPPRATSLPLPTSLAGVSVTINQSSPKQSFAAPLLAVEQVNTCSNSAASVRAVMPSDCLMGAITLQIPFEVSAGSGDAAAPQSSELVITANGAASQAFSIAVVTDTLHVLNTCDAFPSKQSGSQILSADCNSMVTHADGKLVTAGSPAESGETVVIYAYGLGQTTPAVKSGEATPTPAPTLPSGEWFSRTVAIQYDFRPNAGPSVPYVALQGAIIPNPFSATEPVPVPLFVGLTPGQVGLYQINLKLPSTFPAIPACSPASVVTGSPHASPSVVRSNLTVDIGGVSSFDGAAICVRPPV